MTLVTGPTLTDRQLEVLATVVDSASICEAADRLHLSAHTVRAHLRDARERTGSLSRAQLVAFCDDYFAGWRERRPAA
jgi:DNA-binding CsgD family transcriptional regulator